MKKKTKVILAVSSLVLVGLGYGAYQLLTPSATPIDEKATVSSNYYQAINKDWLLAAEIPKDQPANSAAYEIQESVDDKLKSDFKNLSSGKEKSDIEGMDEFIEFYDLLMDFDAREKAGVEPIKPFLKDIENLKSLEDLSQNIVSRTKDGLIQPVSIAITPDLKNTSKKIISLSSPSLFLLDASYYKDEASKKQLTKLFTESTVNLLTKVGYNNKESKSLVEKALDFDSQIAQYAYSSEDLADVEKTYNLRSAKEVKAYSKTFDFTKAINELVGEDVETINVDNPEFFAAFDKVVSPENFDKIKAWLLINEIQSATPVLTDDIRVAGGAFGRAIGGVAEAESKEDAAYNLALGNFYPIISTYYGKKYFGEEAKKDVTDMVDNTIAVYKNRLDSKEWLSKETRAKAVEKLDKMTYYIGYPEEVPEEIKRVDINPNDSLVDNIIRISRESIAYGFEHFNEPIDKDVWAAPSFEVNAFYNPLNNSITLPAAILADPFYSKDNSTAQNYGAIGTVIGHELTHSFDNNGSKFDAEGNLKDWWTKADYKAFEDKTQQMINLWDGIEIYGDKVNGKLTVSENIADAGGLSAALESLQTKEPKANLKPFFEQFAKIERSKASLEYNRLLLTLDTHAPSELRVNMQLKNFPGFYETYDIKEGDDMFLPEDKRVSIW